MCFNMLEHVTHVTTEAEELRDLCKPCLVLSFVDLSWGSWQAMLEKHGPTGLVFLWFYKASGEHLET